MTAAPVDSSPSQERLTRIAAMLREAERGMPVTVFPVRRIRRERARREVG